MSHAELLGDVPWHILDEPAFVASMRAIFTLPLPDNLVLIGFAGPRRAVVVMPPTRGGAVGLSLTFSRDGEGDVSLLSTLITTDPTAYAAWADRPFSTQAVITAFEDLCFRQVAPDGGIQ